jgi:hypothetical protein
MDAILPPSTAVTASPTSGRSRTTRTLRPLDHFCVVGSPRPHEQDDDENVDHSAQRGPTASVLSALRQCRGRQMALARAGGRGRYKSRLHKCNMGHTSGLH